MKCNHCGSEWTTAVNNQKGICPFCGKQLKSTNKCESKAEVEHTDEYLDKLIDDALARRNKEDQWEQLLGCKLSKKPWIIKSGLFVSDEKRVEKIIARIENIHDQELLALIAKETNNDFVWLAATKNITDQSRLFSIIQGADVSQIILREAVIHITDQSVLNKLANNKHNIVRIAVARRSKDQKVLEQLIYNDPDESVRKVVLERVRNERAIEQIALKNSNSNIRAAALKRITNERAIEQIALKDSDSNIRAAALERITNERVIEQIALKDSDSNIRAAALKRITDERVIEQIALKDSDSNIRAAALKRITDERVIEQIALKDSDSNIRAAALERITNEVVIREIAKNDLDAHIRNTAFLRIALPSELKEYLMSSQCSNDISYLSRIVNASDLLDLALTAESIRIRTVAAERMPTDSLEGGLLRVASDIFRELTPINMIDFQTIADKLKKKNPEFLKRIARDHHSEEVRFLAWEVMGWPFDESISAEKRLKLKTPTKNILHCSELKSIAKLAASGFVEQCEEKARSGQHSHEIKIYRETSWDDYPFKCQKDAEQVKELVRSFLINSGLTSISYTIVKEKGYGDSTGYVVMVSTSW